MNKRFPLSAGIGILIVVVLIAGVGLYVVNKPSATSAPASTSDTSTPGAFASSVGSTTDSATSSVVSITTPTVQAPPNSKLYQSSDYHFSVYYPDHLSLSQQGVGGGAAVMLFKDKARSEGFQIFVTPYGDQKITQDRFKMDEPSGVMNDPQNITIDGAAATEFLSTNPAMGTSREIWFLHGGYLFEVTAPQPLDAWLLSIMETWKFT
jgi:hypothetical protein